MKYMLFVLLVATNLVMLHEGKEYYENKAKELKVSQQELLVERSKYETRFPSQIKFLNEKVYDSKGCYLIGPMYSRKSPNVVLKFAESRQIQLSLMADMEKTLLGYRVFSGPYDDDKANDVYKELSQYGIEELKLISDSDGVKVSLGVVGYEAKAEEMSSQLLKNNYEAQIEEEEVKVKTRYWISVDEFDIRQEAEFRNAILERLKGLEDLNYLKVQLLDKCPAAKKNG